MEHITSLYPAKPSTPSRLSEILDYDMVFIHPVVCLTTLGTQLFAFFIYSSFLGKPRLYNLENAPTVKTPKVCHHLFSRELYRLYFQITTVKINFTYIDTSFSFFLIEQENLHPPDKSAFDSNSSNAK